ncbi:MAG: beta-propeller domain-containing protein [Phycisphaerae bacterium]
MASRFRLQVSALAAVVLVTLAVGGCPLDPAGTNNGGSSVAKLRHFGSASEFLTFFRSQARQRTSSGLRALFAPAAAEDAAGGANTATGGSGDGSADSFSTTNIQEEGVDESDLVKSDGVNFYIAKGRSLRIVRANPANELAQVGKLDFDAPIDSLYLYNGRLIVLLQRFSFDGPNIPAVDIAIWPPYFQATETTVSEIDVSDPANPRVARSVTLDGTIASSRLTNNRVVLVMTIVPELPANPTIFNLNALTLQDVLPKARSSAGENIAIDWPDILRPEDPNGDYMTAVVTLDAANVESIVSSTAILADAGTIYASTEALYVTDTEFNLAGDGRETTAVHKFKFDENGAAVYAASGNAPGRLLNQFSLGEHNGFLRAATHVDNFSLFRGGPVFIGFGPADEPIVSESSEDAPRQPYNGVYVLGESEGVLNVVGAVENIAPGEQLYSARFLGDRGFLVTFVQVDPLFALDLSNPAQPRIVGELKVPGYSDYLHPIGANHLVGVGRSIENQAGFPLRDALQLSLFDVSNLAAPTLVQQVEIGGMGSYSDVSYTHKAFTYLADRGLLAIPGQLYRNSTSRFDFGGIAFDGVLVFQVDPATGFTELGRVASVISEENQLYAYTPWRRAAFIGDTVYSISYDGVRAANLTNFDTTTALTLPPNPEDISPFGGAEDGGAGRAASGR